MKRLILFFLLLPIIGFSNPGNSIIDDINRKIDELQYEMDAADGDIDGNITLPNTYNSERATELYINVVNQLQREITDKDQSWQRTRDELRKVKGWFLDIPSYRYGEQQYLDQFELAYSLFLGINDSFVHQTMSNYFHLAIEYYEEIENKPYAYDILKEIVNEDAQFFMRNIETFEGSPALGQIVDELVAKNPIKMKRWVTSDNPIGNQIKQSKAKPTIAFRQMMAEYGFPSKGYYFLQDVVDGKITAEEAHNYGTDLEKFRHKLIEYSKRQNIIGREAIDGRLKDESLNVIRPINNLHETKDPKIRFKSVENLTASEFYTYIIYPQEEIFTSTYNGFYERLIKKLGKQNTYDFLEEMNFNHYRTFIKMAAGYNKLEDFLNRMSEEQQRDLLNRFVSNLEEGEIQESLQASVEVADTFGSITDQELREFFANKMKEEYLRVSMQEDKHGVRIYSLLNGILAQNDDNAEEWMKDMVNNKVIPNITSLDYKSLVNHEGKIIQQVFFYDDDDGKASFNSFMPSFRNGNWTIEDKTKYVKITSKDELVEIYANKPQYEFDGKAELRRVFREMRESPSVVIHRGHSFYVDTTINSLTPNAKLVLLGSCGSYHSLRSVIEHAPDVHIISSKQIGSMGVNDPMIRLMNKQFLKKEDIDWQEFWTTLDAQLKPNKKSHERFQDYVPPHKNLGAIFMMAYNRLRNLDES